MTEVHLRLPGGSFSLRAPSAALERLPLLYHESAIESGPAPGDPAASFELEPADDGWRLSEAGSPAPLGTFGNSLYALLRLEHAIEERLLARLDGGVAFHAGAVVVDGGACLLAGSADRGKSSSTFHLVELGHTFLAEEIAAVGLDDRVRPYPRSLALDPRVVEELGRHHPLTHGRADAVDDLLTRYMPHRLAPEPAPLASLVLPAYRPEETPSIERLPVESVLTELLGYCFEPGGDQEVAIDRIIELASTRPILRIRYPDAVTARRLFQNQFGRARR